MKQLVGSPARRALSLGSALLLVLAIPLAISAQDGQTTPSDEPTARAAVESPVASTQPESSTAPGPSAEPSANLIPSAGAAPAASAPGQLQQARFPKGAQGHNVSDVIEGGPGYIAVGGGSPDGLDLRSFVWLSGDGRLWEQVRLKGKAAQGRMTSVAALPAGGYVAVGHDFQPEGKRADMVRAFVWFSKDGTKWKRVSMDKSVKGSAMWDITATPDGVAVAGCLSGFHCDIGRVWTSSDGRAWDLVDDIAMAPYRVASDADGNIVVAGVDDGYAITLKQATMAASADDWSVQVLATPESQIQGLTAHGDGLLAAGSLWDLEDSSYRGTALQSSDDGVAWELMLPERLAQIAVGDISADGDLVAVTGTAVTEDFIPVVLWARDLDSFEAIELPEQARPNQASLSGVRVTDDGSRIFAYGSEKGRPMIWLSTVE